MVARCISSRFWFLAFPLLLCGRTAFPAPAVNPAFAAEIASRTVMVKVAGMSPGTFTTGFVWGRRDGVSYVVTVLSPYSPGELAFELKSTRFPPAKVVVNVGTRRELEHEGELVAYDGVLGLALVAVKADSLPAPPGFWRQPIQVGTPLCVACCRAPVERQGGVANQPVAVEIMHLGAMRKSKALDMLQLDGKIPEGGEGGPVLLSNGTLAGFCHFQLGDTLIGMAVPVAAADRFLSGAPSRPMPSQGTGPDAGRLHVAVPLLDAQNLVRTCSLYVLPRQDVPMPDFPEDGKWSLLRPGMREITLQVTRPACLWESALADSGLLPGDYWLQASTTLADGSRLFSMPTGFRIQPSQDSTATAPTHGAPPQAAGIDAAVRLPDAPARTRLRIARLRTQDLGTHRFSEVVFCEDSDRPPPVANVIPNDAVWSANGDALYTLWAGRSHYADTDGHAEILVFSYPECKETASVRIAPRFSAIRLVPRGLLCVVPDAGLLLLDPATLAVQDRLSVPGMHDLAVSGQGDYAIGIGRPEDRESRDAGIIPFLHVVDLESWRVERVYRGTGIPATAAPAGAEALGLSLANPLLLTDDGSRLLVGAGEGEKRRTTVFPFRQGQVAWQSGVALPFAATRLVARPGGSGVLAEQALAPWPTPEDRPDGAPANGSESAWLFDAAKPGFQPDGRLWGQRAEVSEDRAFVYTNWQGRLRVLGTDGKEETAVPLPHATTYPLPQLGALLPSRSGHGTYLVKGRTCYLLETGTPPRPEAAPAAAVAGDGTEAPSTAATGIPLEGTTTRADGWERQLVRGKGLPDATLLPEEDGNIVYALNSRPTGRLRRLDLQTMRETHCVEGTHAFADLCRPREGVLVAVSDVGVADLRLYDPDTFRLLRTWPMPGPVTHLASRPATAMVLMRDERKRVVLFDCAAGAITQTCETLPVPEGCPPAADGDPPLPILSRDGAYAYAVQGGRLLRWRIDGGRLLPDGFGPEPMGDGYCVAIDPRRQYVAVRCYAVSVGAGTRGWATSRLDEPDATRKREDSLLIVDAESLVPVRRFHLAGVSMVAFDLEQSQLVTPGERRIFPDGGVVAGGLEQRSSTQGPVFEKCGGWFYRREKEGLCRFRTATMILPLGVAPGEYRP